MSDLFTLEEFGRLSDGIRDCMIKVETHSRHVERVVGELNKLSMVIAAEKLPAIAPGLALLGATHEETVVDFLNTLKKFATLTMEFGEVIGMLGDDHKGAALLIAELFTEMRKSTESMGGDTQVD